MSVRCSLMEKYQQDKGELFELTEESKKILGIQIALFSKLVELVKLELRVT